MLFCQLHIVHLRPACDISEYIAKLHLVETWFTSWIIILSQQAENPTSIPCGSLSYNNKRLVAHCKSLQLLKYCMFPFQIVFCTRQNNNFWASNIHPVKWQITQTIICLWYLCKQASSRYLRSVRPMGPRGTVAGSWALPCPRWLWLA